MNQVIPTVSVAKARSNRARWWWQSNMGVSGVAALTALALGVVLLAAVRPGVEAKRQALVREQAQRLAALVQQHAKPPGADAGDVHDQVRSSIPALARRGETVARMMDLAGASGVTFDRAEYATTDQEPNLSRLKVTLPFSGSYAQTRTVIARLLNGLPNAALDSIDIERPNVEHKLLDGTLRLSLYFRKDAP